MRKGIVQVAGIDYHWSIYRQPRWTGDGVLLGLAILVKPVKASQRELVLEYTMDSNRFKDIPSGPKHQVSKRRLIECIQNALNAGWDPESRGKEFFFNAGVANPN